MKLSSNQRKHLEAIANHLDPIMRIGKNGLEAKIVSSINEAFSSNELIKIKILDSAPVEAEEVVAAVLKPTGATLVRIIGRVIVLFKAFTDKPGKIGLPEPR